MAQMLDQTLFSIIHGNKKLNGSLEAEISFVKGRGLFVMLKSLSKKSQSIKVAIFSMLKISAADWSTIKVVKIQPAKGSIRIDPDYTGYGWGSDPSRVDPDQVSIHPDRIRMGIRSNPLMIRINKSKNFRFHFSKILLSSSGPPQFKRHRLIERTISKLKVQVSQFRSSESQPKLKVELKSTTCNAFHRCI